MQTYGKLAIPDERELVFGTCPHPVRTRSGMVVGGGQVYPELNFTLPAMHITEATFPSIREHYQRIVRESLTRAAELEAPGVTLEFETLPPMTEHPEWGIDLTRILLDGIAAAESRYGLKAALRVTPNDNREMVRPPRMRSGPWWEGMVRTFEGAAAAGADFLSIESVGGKEVHDEALSLCDIKQVIFALCIMGVRDMQFLWREIVTIANRHGRIPAGDTACGFGNTAMVLAEQRLIPRVFAAIVRPITAVRTLVAYECGARGPGKDCGYENVVLKAITGCPMAMEGKTAACAHLSPVGNIAAAACDLWSNESVQNLQLLSGSAPRAYMEQLVYDCRLMNQASGSGRDGALMLRNWLVASDSALDPQAYILRPDMAVRFAAAIVGAPDHYLAGRAVGLEVVAALREGMAAGAVRVAQNERRYLDRVAADLEDLPDSEEAFIEEMMEVVDTSKFTAADYGLPD